MHTPSDLRDLYAEFGIAAEQAQVLELEAGNVALMFLAVFLKPEEITKEQREMFKSVVEDVDRKTLGRLLKNIKKTAQFDEAILEAVDVALERRNYLIHKFYRHHNFAIHSEDGRKIMIEELKDIQQKLTLAHTMLLGVSSALESMAGKEGMANEIAKEFMAKGEKVEI